MDKEMLNALYQFDTGNENIKLSGMVKKVADTVAYAQASKGLYPDDVANFISDTVMTDISENLTPRDYESFSKSRGQIYNAHSSLKSTSVGERPEDEEFDVFMREVKGIILDELETEKHFKPFNVDKIAKEYAREEQLKHTSKGNQSGFCMNPNVAKRICER